MFTVLHRLCVANEEAARLTGVVGIVAVLCGIGGRCGHDPDYHHQAAVVL